MILERVMMIRLKPLTEQVIVITGASSGIGRATSLMAAAEGACVVVAARGSEGLDTLVAEILAGGGRVIACVTDMTDAVAVERLAAFAIDTYGRIDTWVNNAGVAIAGKLEDLSDGDARRVFDINFWGMVHGCKAALPHLKRQGGVLINMGSVTSDVSAPFMGLYSASKQAIKGYTDALRIELMMDKAPVAVTLIKPSPIATPILEHRRNRMDHQATMPPPSYKPDDVVKAILLAAVNPGHDRQPARSRLSERRRCRRGDAGTQDVQDGAGPGSSTRQSRQSGPPGGGRRQHARSRLACQLLYRAAYGTVAARRDRRGLRADDAAGRPRTIRRFQEETLPSAWEGGSAERLGLRLPRKRGQILWRIL